MTQPALTWSAYEHEHVERSTEWYWALGVVAVSLGLSSVLLGNLLFAFIIVIGAAIMGLLASKPPTLTHVEISDRGIRVADGLHLWGDVISFWVDTEESEVPLLLVDTTKFLSPNIVIPIVDIDPDDVRTWMREHTEEVYMREPLSQKIFELLGF